MKKGVDEYVLFLIALLSPSAPLAFLLSSNLELLAPAPLPVSD